MSALEITESCCRFGAGRRLAGVVTEPAAPARAGFVLVSAGLTPKFGPFRLYARLARRLAQEGFAVLRFDLGGIGDSGAGDGASPLRERTATEIRAAVEHLSAGRRLDGLVLGGLCSGAEDSFRYAETDARVTGLLLMDPFGYKTWGWRAREWGVRAARGALRLLGLVPPAPADGAPALIDYRHMDHPEASRILRALVRRGVCLHFVYTGGMRESFNHRGQLRAMFAGIELSGLATLDYFPRLRHTQELEADRCLVIDSIARRFACRS
jgi:pimeloyl-ACP methyl ester carboxylesterase